MRSERMGEKDVQRHLGWLRDMAPSVEWMLLENIERDWLRARASEEALTAERDAAEAVAEQVEAGLREALGDRGGKSWPDVVTDLRAKSDAQADRIQVLEDLARRLRAALHRADHPVTCGVYGGEHFDATACDCERDGLLIDAVVLLPPCPPGECCGHENGDLDCCVCHYPVLAQVTP